jgi:transposase
MWCIPGELDDEYISRMEDILDLLEKPLDIANPVVCLDERPVQLLDDIRSVISYKPGRIAKRDSEYKRCGTANIFAIHAPFSGDHLCVATKNRKGTAFAKMMKKTAEYYCNAEIIHLIMDNLNTHSLKSLVAYFGEEAGNELWNRFHVHYTPKHGSWLNPAEIEISLISREALGKDRISTFENLKKRVSAWNRKANRLKRRINWTFTSKAARMKFKYSKRKLIN